MNTFYFQKGQIFLGIVLLIGAIVLMAGALLAFIANSSVDTGYGLRSSAVAEAAAEAGAKDSILFVERGLSGPSYSFNVGSTTVTVYIDGGRDCPTADPQTMFSCPYINQYINTFISVATSNNRTSMINTVISITSSTQQVSVISWNQVQ